MQQAVSGKIKLRRYNYDWDEVSKGAKMVLYSIFTVYSLACILPVLLIVAISISNNNDLINYGYSLLPKHIDFTAYIYIFRDVNVILRAYGVTIIIAISGTILNVLITAMFAYPLSRDQFYFKRFFTIMILIPGLFSGGMVPFYIVYTNVMHFNNTLMALIFPGLFGGFNAIIVRTYLKANNMMSILEAAYIDGASELAIFFRIVLPLCVPVLATIAFFSFLGYWNEWFNCLLFITNEKLYTLQYVMMRALREVEFFKQNMQLSGLLRSEIDKIPSESVRMAMAVVGMAPILIAYPFFQKYFVKGMILGAVKG